MNGAQTDKLREQFLTGWTVSLPMYNLPEMRPANAMFWRALHSILRESGVLAPEALLFESPPLPQRILPATLFSQTCGYPLETIYAGQAIKLGTPCYDAMGCDGPSHCGFFIVSKDSPFSTLKDLAGARFLLNNRHSNSGMNLPRRALAEIAQGQSFFAEVIETGSQPGNLDRIVEGNGDVTSVDCVTFAFWSRYRPEAAKRIRVLARTQQSPAIPFVTSVFTPPAVVTILQQALRIIARDTRFHNVRRALLINDIVDVPEERYRRLLDYEREAENLGYGVLV